MQVRCSLNSSNDIAHELCGVPESFLYEQYSSKQIGLVKTLCFFSDQQQNISISLAYAKVFTGPSRVGSKSKLNYGLLDY